MADWTMNGTAGSVTDSSIPATATTLGAVQLAGDLGGTADSPTVVGTHLSAYTSAARPTAAAEHRGRLIAIKNAGEAEEVQYCREDAVGGYEWITVAF